MPEERKPAQAGWPVCALPEQCWIIGTVGKETILVRDIGLCDLVQPFVFSSQELAQQFIDKRGKADCEKIEGPKPAKEFDLWFGSICKYQEAIVDPPNIDGKAPYMVALL